MKETRMAKKPKPVPVSLVCSLCGQDWGKHGDDPTPETCIGVLKAELARRPNMTWTSGYASSGNLPTASVTTATVGEHGPEWVVLPGGTTYTRSRPDDGTAGVLTPAA